MSVPDIQISLSQAQPGDEEKIRALPWSIGFSVLSGTVFCAWTFFGSVFVLYLQALHLPKGHIGALLSVFPFCGLMAPLVAPALARIGLKRASIIAYAGRSVTAGLLLLLPIVLAAGGRAGAVVYLSGVILLFALFRSLAETAILPWSQEYTPAAVRGKFSAATTIVGTLAGMAATALAGYLVSHSQGLERFLWLQGAGCIAGLAGVTLLLRVPGGASLPPREDTRAHRAELRQALGDANFRHFLVGTAGLTLGGGMIAAFMPLMLVEKVGLPPGTVIWLDLAVGFGGMAACYLAGWSADRFGSRTVLMPGLTMNLELAVIWSILLATGHAAGMGIVMVALMGCLGGIANIAIGIGTGRLLLTGVVPPNNSVAYTAIYYAWCGLVAGIAPLLAGGILSLVSGTREGGVTAMGNPYAVLFLLSLAPTALGWLFFSRTRPDGATRTRDLMKHLVSRIAFSFRNR